MSAQFDAESRYALELAATERRCAAAGYAARIEFDLADLETLLGAIDSGAGQVFLATLVRSMVMSKRAELLTFEEEAA